MRNQIKQHNFFKKQPLGESEKKKMKARDYRWKDFREI